MGEKESSKGGSDIPTEVLEQTHEQADKRLEQQRKELRSIRETALKTLRATILLIGIIVTFSANFSSNLAAWGAQPVPNHPAVIPAGIFILGGPFLLFISPIFAAWALRDAYFSEKVDGEHIEIIANGGIISDGEDQFRKTPGNIVDWYQHMIDRKSNIIKENDSVLNKSSATLQFSHWALVLAPSSTSLGLIIMNML